MAKKRRNWESNPWFWFGIVVVSGVTTTVISSALQKWWGLKLERELLQKVRQAG